jgi:hypothetical protein
MQKNLLRFALPAVLAIFAYAPGYTIVPKPQEHEGMRMAQDAPPRSRHETRPSRPSKDHLWINGYWERQNEKWAWAGGRWETPSRKGSTWIKPKYHHEKDGYRYEAGRWSE